MKRTTAAAAALTLTLGLAACQPEPVPTPNPEPAPAEAGSVMSEDRLNEVLADISAQIAAADAVADADELGDRVLAPAREMRAGQYALTAVTGGSIATPPIAVDSQSSAVVATTKWPRVAEVITTIPTGSNLPLLIFLVQENPRDKFGMWSWVRLFPGTESPATTRPAIGSAPVAPDQDGLLMTPEETLAAYADLLNNRTDSEFAATFTEEPHRAGHWQTVDSLATAVEAAGTVTQNSAVSDYDTYAIGTHDGGAIVMGLLNQEIVLTRTVEDATLSVGPILAYGEDPTVDGSLTASYLLSVAFYIPPATDGEGQITVLGAEQALLDVVRAAPAPAEGEDGEAAEGEGAEDGEDGEATEDAENTEDDTADDA
ncbi:MAG TPA: hypothetical protein GX743_03330 [Actinomycetales bacterium]|nr:hypothetical protein [Actinomycetales bacterium]